jgi:hypothetical protein
MPSPRSAVGQRAWRQKAAANPSGGGGKMLPRIMSSLLGIGLLGLLVGLIWWWFFLPRTYFASLPVVNYGVLAVPAIPFAHEDSAAFAAIGPAERTVSLGDFEIARNLGTLSEGLQKLAIRRHDVLILSIDAHGASDDGIAYLLASDYLSTPAIPDFGRYKLSDLLAKLHESSAGVKLLILDANHLACDPRLGIVANEFSRLLDEEVRKINDPALWVISSAGPLQLSHESLSAQRSIFSVAVTEGLRGAADSNRNGKVELGELYDYVRREVPRMASQLTPEPQRPLLYRGGVGLADPPDGLILTTDSRAKSAADPQEKAPPDKQLIDDREKLKKTLEAAWALRDAIQDRSQDDGWTPIDYAPHLWREFQDLLLGYERRYRSGQGFDAKKLAAELRKEIDAWDVVARSPDSPPSAEIELVLRRLGSARLKFLQSDAKKRFDANDDRAAAAKKLLRLKNDLVFWMPYYVRWHAGVSSGAEQEHPLFRPLAGLLDRLAEFCQSIAEVENSGMSNTPGALSLDADVEELERMRDALRTRNLEAEIQNVLETPKKAPRPKTAIAEIEALLATPLPSAGERSQLLAVRDKIEPTLESDGSTEQGKSPKQNPSFAPEWRWRRLVEQADLEGKLVLLADPTSEIALPKDVLKVDSLEAERSRWQAFRQFGKRLGDFYAGLPGRINQSLEASDQSSQRATERLLRLTDGRDAERIDARDPERTDVRAIACAVPLLPDIQQPANRLTLGVDKSLQLPRKGWLPLAVSLQNTVASSDTAKVAVQFDADLLEIVDPQNNQPVRPGKQISVAFNQETTKSLKLQARAKRASDFKTNVEIEASLGDQSVRAAVNLRLAPPDVIDLTILAFGHAIRQSSPSADRLRLWPYPNRATTYTLALVNRSGRARNITVELFALPPPPRGERELTGPLVDSAGKPRVGLIVLSGPEPLQVTLPADDTPVTITFPPPNAPPDDKAKKEPDKAIGDKAGDAKPEEKPKPAAELTHGMVCIVRDAETKEPRWIKRIDCAPRRPRDYVQPTVRYDAGHGRVSISMTADEGMNPPPLSPESPLSIVWENAGESTAVGTVIDRAAVTESGKSATLSADVEPAPGKKIVVQLAVDGDPRAFVYEVPCEKNDSKAIDPQSDHVAIHIAAPPNGQPFRVPLKEPIPLELQVDAPPDAFLNDADSAQVMIVAEANDRELCAEEHRWFYSDRQVRVFLNELSPSGEMKISTTVGDFRLPLGVGGLVNTRARIMGQVSVNNPNLPEQRIERSAFVGILLQGDPPVLKELGIEPEKAIPRGQPIKAFVTVAKELSAIKEMQVGIDRDNSGALEEAEKPVKLHQADDNGKWQAKIPTEDLEPGRYTLMAKAADVLGFESKSIARTIIVEPPAPPLKTATMSTIVGRVVDQDGRPLPRIRVTLQGTGLSETSDESGAFSFKDVPHGKYKLEARGIVIGSERTAVQEIVLPGATEPAKVDIRIKW